MIITMTRAEVERIVKQHVAEAYFADVVKIRWIGKNHLLEVTTK